MNKNKITKYQWKKYLQVQRSGITNMNWIKLLSNSHQLRIAYCKDTKRNVLQELVLNPENWVYPEWLCLHRDTLEQEQQEMEEFLKYNTNGTLVGNPNIQIKDLELISGHLINPKMGIDICLWPTSPTDQPDPVTLYPKQRK